jgi:hypothetical protein
MSFFKFIIELVVAYYVIKFVLNFISTAFFVKQAVNKAKTQAQQFTNTNTEKHNTATTFTQPKKSMDIKDGEYIEYEEVKK